MRVQGPRIQTLLYKQCKQQPRFTSLLSIASVIEFRRNGTSFVNMHSVVSDLVLWNALDAGKSIRNLRVLPHHPNVKIQALGQTEKVHEPWSIGTFRASRRT